jgi:hypothetical protein
MCAKVFQDQVTELHASIDGQDITEIELKKYRVQSPLFYFTLPENNILDLPANTTTQAVSDGNSLKLPITTMPFMCCLLFLYLLVFLFAFIMIVTTIIQFLIDPLL